MFDNDEMIKNFYISILHDLENKYSDFSLGDWVFPEYQSRKISLNAAFKYIEKWMNQYNRIGVTELLKCLSDLSDACHGSNRTDDKATLKFYYGKQILLEFAKYYDSHVVSFSPNDWAAVSTASEVLGNKRKSLNDDASNPNISDDSKKILRKELTKMKEQEATIGKLLDKYHRR